MVASGGGRMRSDSSRLSTSWCVPLARTAASLKDLKTAEAFYRVCMDQATKLLARNSADLGTEVAKFADELARMTGQLAQMRQDMDGLRAQSAQLAGRVEVIEKQLGISRDETGKVVLDPTAVFDGAYKKLQAGQYAVARQEFTAFVQGPAPSKTPTINSSRRRSTSWVTEENYE